MSYIFDLDGTLFEHGTNTPLPGAKEMIAGLRAKGADIYITTYRGERWGNHPIFNANSTLVAVKEHFGVNYGEIIMGSHSPRVVINDSGAAAHNHVPGAPWTVEEIESLVHREMPSGYTRK